MNNTRQTIHNKARWIVSLICILLILLAGAAATVACVRPDWASGVRKALTRLNRRAVAVTTDENTEPLTGDFDANVLFIGFVVFAESFVNADDLGRLPVRLNHAVVVVLTLVSRTVTEPHQFHLHGLGVIGLELKEGVFFF